jgi:hypothetical protein
MLAPNAMCGHVIVGMKYCGFSGNCQHKSVAEMIENKVKEATNGAVDNGKGGTTE